MTSSITRVLAVALASTALLSAAAAATPPANATAAAPGPAAASRTHPVSAAAARPSPTDAHTPVVYLSFDDGPTGQTAAVLAVLNRYHAHATFFMIGQQVAKEPAAVRAILGAGDAIGNHSWSHPHLTRLSSAQVRSQLASTSAAIEKVAPGYRVTCFRPPGGATNARVAAVGKSLGLRQWTWTIDPRDWTSPGASAVASRVISHLRPGSVVLMHDGAGHGGQAAAALPRILRYIASKGWTTQILPGCAVPGTSPTP